MLILFASAGGGSLRCLRVHRVYTLRWHEEEWNSIVNAECSSFRSDDKKRANLTMNACRLRR
jgi:hypothetical protein